MRALKAAVGEAQGDQHREAFQRICQCDPRHSAVGYILCEAHGAFGHAAGGAEVEIAIGAVLVGVSALASSSKGTVLELPMKRFGIFGASNVRQSHPPLQPIPPEPPATGVRGWMWLLLVKLPHPTI